MPFLTRKRLLIFLPALFLALAAWLYFQRYNRVALATYVPATAMGFLEVNDLPSLLDNFTSTEAWRQLAPVYGLSDSLRYTGWASRLGRWTGIGSKETLLLARGQVLVVVSRIEVRGDEVKPNLAIVLETHGSAASVRALMAEWLPQIAARAYQNPVSETSEYSGVPITILRAPQGERRILSAGIGSTWIIANDAESLQSCIDVRQGRVPAMADNALLPQARAELQRTDDIFAFVNQAGTARLAQFFTHLLLGRTLTGTPLAGMPEGLTGEVSQGTIEALAYSASFEDSGVRDRYAVLCKPDVVASLRASFRPPDNAELEKSAALQLVPAGAEEVTLVNVEDPGAALDGVERIISAHLGAAQSFLFNRFFASARKTFLGLEKGESATSAAGQEVVRFSVPTTNPNSVQRLWLVAARNRPKLAQLAERLLQQRGAAIGRIHYQGTELTSTNQGKRAFAFVNNHLVLGNTEQIMRLIEGHKTQPAWLKTEPFTKARLPEKTAQGLLYGFASVSDETNTLMQVVARRLKGNPQADASLLLKQLPWATAVTTLTERGLYREAYAPLGNFPLAATFADAVF